MRNIRFKKTRRIGKGAQARVKYIAMFLFSLFVVTAMVFAFNNNNTGENYGRDFTHEGFIHEDFRQEIYYTFTIPRGQSIADILPESPGLAGHLFSHWSLAQDGAFFDFRQLLYEDTTFYAIWVANDDYTGTYNEDTYEYNQDEDVYEYEYEYEETSSDEYGYINKAPHLTNCTDSCCAFFFENEEYDYGYNNDYEYAAEYEPAEDYNQIYSSTHYGYESNWHRYAFYENGFYENDHGYTGNYHHDDYSGYSGDSWPQYYGYEGYDYERYNDVYGYDYYYDRYEYDGHSYEDDDYGGYIGPEICCDECMLPQFEAYGFHNIIASDDDLITITFMWNHSGRWADCPGTALYVNITERGSVFVIPKTDHSIALDGDFMYVRIPGEIEYYEITTSLPYGWTYEITHETVESEEYAYFRSQDGYGDQYDYDDHAYITLKRERIYTVIRINHTWNSGMRAFGGFGIVPFGSNPPNNFSMHTLQGFELGDWNDALGGNNDGNRVVVVPPNATLPGQISLGGTRHIILVSEGTDLDETLDDHVFTGTPSVVTHIGGTNLRHFVLNTGLTLTLSHITLDGNVPPPSTIANRGGITLNAGSNLYMLQGSVIRHSRIASGGGVSAAGTGTFNMSGNASITNNSAGTAGGGVNITGARTLNMSGSASISNNTSSGNGGGIQLAANNAILVMTGASTVSHNLAMGSGGGVSIASNGAQLTMNGGSISNNTANHTGIAQGGGGVFIAPAVANANAFTFNHGTMSNNHAVTNGGGIFASNLRYVRPLPAGSFPQVSVSAIASFSGNTAGLGGFTPPVNAATATSIAYAASRSGGFSHPLNNLDINFFAPSTDWFRLNNAINNTTAANIVIHPSGAPVTPGLDGGGTTYNLVITDPGNGSTITTIHLHGTATDHTINIARAVTLSASPGSNIVIRIPVPGGANTPNSPPWITTLTAIGRHFILNNGAALTLGGGPGSGTLTLDGNAHLLAQARGGIQVNAGAGLVVQQGGAINNNRNANGGGVLLNAGTATLNMTGGSISNNFSTGNGGGVTIGVNGASFTMSGGTISGNLAATSGGGVAMTVNNTHFTMNGGYITSNTANSTVALNGGGGVFIAQAVANANAFTFNNGTISYNTALGNGGGIFTANFSYQRPLPPTGAFSQLSVSATAIFTGNNAVFGGFAPPTNAAAVTNITNGASRSGGFSHPLNNLDINFVAPEADWFRLSSLINHTTVPNIVIHPAGSSVTPGLDGLGTTYNLVITDPGDGSTITTIHLSAGVTDQNINIARAVTISAAPGSDIVIRMPVPGAPNTPSTAPWVTTQTILSRHFILNSGGNLTLGAPGSGTLTLDGNAHLLIQARGGIQINAGATLTLQQGGTIYNNRNSNGGGVLLNGGTAILNMQGGSITNNISTGNGGGVVVGVAGAQFTMASGTISGNTATTSGGGVALTANTTTFTMNGGTITGNTANSAVASQGGGGVFIASTVANVGAFTFAGGTISNNHSAGQGGGIFTANFVYANPLPASGSFPQLSVSAAANFSGNTAGQGGFPPPANAAAATSITNAASRSGGFGHPLNNLDINFFSPVADWFRLHNLITQTTVPNIIIHPTGSSATPGLVSGGSIYNFIITDPGNGSTITTISLQGGTTDHFINVGRAVSISAVAGADIVIRMPVPGAPNTPNTAPWVTTLTTIGRHFNIVGGNLTLGGGAGSGTLTLDGNANIVTANRGGISITGAGSTLLLQQGGAIHNNRNANGGGVSLNIGTAIFTMTGGSITNNFTGGWGGGVCVVTSGAQFNMSGGTISGNASTNSGGGVALAANNTHFTMNGGTITGNSATGQGADQGGGGVFIATTVANNNAFAFNNGTISNNTATGNGGGVFAANFLYLRPLPAGAFPQLSVSPTAIFSGNTAGFGGFTPPANAAAATSITNGASRSGGFAHPLNNLDINFFAPESDWLRLNNLITRTTVPNIVIHPTGSPVTPGLDGGGTTYNLVVTDPGNGSTITTIHLQGGATPHNINIARAVNISAAPGSDIVIRMPVAGAPNTPNSAPWLTAQTTLARHFILNSGAHLTLGGGPGSGTLTLDGNAHLLTTQARGGIQVNTGANFTLQQGGVIYNNRATNGGGVVFSSGTTTFNMTGGSILNNFATTNGGGVAVNAGGGLFTMSGGTIAGNTANTSGGGVALTTNNTHFIMNGGTLTGNTAISAAAGQGGGGVFIASGFDSRFRFNNGTMSNNHSAGNGGAVFAVNHEYRNPLPANSFPQLTVSATAIFTGNTAGSGSFSPPSNATSATSITNAASRSGGYSHPLNNLDINFILPDADWFRLFSLITFTPVPNIVIHPTGSPVTPGLDGTTYNFVITDPGDGSTITTVHLQGGTSLQNINIARPLTLSAAPGADIVIRMPVPGAPNTPNTAPWLTTQAALSRHFFVNSGGHFTLGGGTGTITLDGNANQNTSNRGGITVNAGASLTLLSGGNIYNNRIDNGGAVVINGAGTFNMIGGSISNNAVTGNGGGVALTAANAQFIMSGGTISGNTAATSGGGIALNTNNTHITIDGGTITGNTANSATLGQGGGGIFSLAGVNSTVQFLSGTISNNHTNAHGGGIFTGSFAYANPLPMGAFPQLTVSNIAIFSGNTANTGSFNPPANASAATNITNAASRSGGYGHPLNNLDINFISFNADWFRLNTVINHSNAAHIIIHPTGSPVIPGLSGTTYNFVITDPGDGSTISTIHLSGGTSSHSILITRAVQLSAATGSNIVIRMPVPGAPNTPSTAPFTTASTTLERHFIINTGGNLTFGGGPGSGTLTLDGNANLLAQSRGGIGLAQASAILLLQEGGAITNNRIANGGGVSLNNGTAVFNMTGGSISGNFAGTNGGGVVLATAGAQFHMSGGTISGNTASTSGGGVGLSVNNVHFTMNGGTITGNTANSAAAGQGGGGIFSVAGVNTTMQINSGTISYNHTNANGGGIFTGTFSYANPLPMGAYPQLTVGSAVIFTGNTTAMGSFAPPSNAQAATAITNAAQRSGGYSHPLNNLDINFFAPAADWHRLYSLIVHSNVPNIVIHPTGSPVVPGLSGSTYNFIISDPGDGSTITTIHLQGGTSNHTIQVSRHLSIMAANGADITMLMPLPGSPNTPDTAPWLTTQNVLQRHFQLNAGSNFILGGGAGFGTLTLDGNADLNISDRGGIAIMNSASFTLQTGGVITNNRASVGGGIAFSGIDSIFAMTGGSITNNFSTNPNANQGGGGISVGASGVHITMSGGTISGNTAAMSGGGIAMSSDNMHLTINGGTITGNTAYGNSAGNGGGGIFINGPASRLHFNSGTISHNHTESAAGGGIFATAFSYQNPLPAGSFPQLTVASAAIFTGNTTSEGGFTPPANVLTATSITNAAQRSGGFGHPLNNLDINFFRPTSDWLRLRDLITFGTVPNIVIHPTGAPVIPGLSGTTYNFVITDPGNGSTITTIHLDGGTSPHAINVARPVTLSAAPGTNITLRMPVPGAPNTPDTFPWLTTQAILSRHFLINAGGNLTLGSGTGTLTLDGNASQNTSARGGIGLAGVNAQLNLQQGGIIYNNRIATGGGVSLNNASAVFNMAGGSITGNIGTTNGGGVAVVTNGARFNMYGGTITGNTTSGGGGGVHLATGASSLFTFNGGSIVSNHADGGGGGVFTAMFTTLDPLPTGIHYPQLIIEPAAIFNGNTTNQSSFEPPGNAAIYTEIAVTAQRSGGFWHPLNNLDINFISPTADWLRLDYLINTMQPDPPHTIIIHPAGSGILEGPIGAPGTYYNFIVTDMHDGSTFSTLPIGSGTAHTINIANRTVTIQAAPLANITIDMNASGSPGRHISVNANGNLTIGGPGSGNLTIEGNASTISGTRGGLGLSSNAIGSLEEGAIIRGNRSGNGGGINVGDSSTLYLRSGSQVINNFASVGGGIHVGTGGTTVATLNMFDGALVAYNYADGSNGGGGGIGTVFRNHNTIVNMYGGTIRDNWAAHGGGFWVMAATFTMYDGLVTNNYAGKGIGTNSIGNHHGGGGGAMVCCSGHLIMHGGRIYNNTGRTGGGIHLSHWDDILNTPAIFTMHGGTIENNHATLSHLDPDYFGRPGFPLPGLQFDEDGGGVFIMQNGLFIMADPILPDTPPIRINENDADRSGGGVYWEVGEWRAYQMEVVNGEYEQVPRQASVYFQGNTAVEDGGAIYVTYNPLHMFGVWLIEENRANRGGGVFLSGSYNNPDPLKDIGELYMHGGRIYNNWSYTSGGGVYIYYDARFTLLGGSVEYNESARFGGGVYVLNPSVGTDFTSMFVASGGRVRGNRAIYGGGVYLMFRAHMHAYGDVIFEYNVAERMGGAIYTELIDYGYLLSGMEVPHYMLPDEWPLEATEIFYAFANLFIEDTVRFSGNTAVAPFHSPYNALDFAPTIRWRDYSTVAHQYLSIHLHPLNNYDINFVRPVYFYKTDMEIYAYNRVINNRPGAVFELDILVEDENNPGEYIWELYTTATSEANGRITLFVFTPGEFRLREVVPPMRLRENEPPAEWYILPPGHWYLEMDLVPVAGSPGVTDMLLNMENPPPRPCPDNFEFIFVHLDRETGQTIDYPGSQAERMRWHIGNSPPRANIYIHKGDQNLVNVTPAPTTPPGQVHFSQLNDMLLAGAEFVIYRYTEPGTPVSGTVPATGWVRVPGSRISTNNPLSPMVFGLGFREVGQNYSYYQLVEVFAPIGFMAPFGQWRVRMDVLDFPNNITTMTVTTQGDTSTPTMMGVAGVPGHVYAVGNRMSFEMPAAGGRGVMLITTSGSIVVGLGFAALWFMHVRKKRLAMGISPKPAL